MASFGLFGSSAPQIRRLQPSANVFGPTIEDLRAQQMAQLQAADATMQTRARPRLGAFGQGPANPAPAPAETPSRQPSPSYIPAATAKPSTAQDDGGFFRNFGYRPDETGQNFGEWLFSSREDVARAKAEQAGLRAQEQARAAQGAQIDALRKAGVSEPQIIAFLNNPEKWSESYASNIEARNIGGGDSAYVNGALVTAPKLVNDGGSFITQTPDGMTVTGRRDMSYGEMTDAQKAEEDARHNRATEAISRETNAIAAKKAETDSLLSSLPNFGNENQLRTQYLGQAKTFETVRDAYTRIQAVGSARNPAEQMSLIFGYMKLLDPGSTVREGEYASAQNTTGVPGWVINNYNKAKDGVFLNDKQVKDFLGQARAQYSAAAKNYEGVLDQYRDLAGRYKMDPTIIQDFRLPGAGPTAGETAASNVRTARGVGLENAPGSWPLDSFRGLAPPPADDVSDLLDKWK